MTKENKVLTAYHYAIWDGEDYTNQLQALANQVAYVILNRLDWLGDKQALVGKWRAEIARGESDIANTAVVAILEETQAQLRRDPDMLVDLERVYTKHGLKSRVLIKSSQSVAYVDRETTPMQEVYRATRRYIESQRQHVALEDIGRRYIDSDVDGVALLTGKCCDMYGRPCSVGQSLGLMTNGGESLSDTDELIQRLNLTKKQANILSLLLQGYRAEAIATAKGLALKSVQDCIKLIQSKAVAAFGLDESMMDAKPQLRLTTAQKVAIADMLRRGCSYRDIQARTGCGSKTITSIKRRFDIK